jgi:hypothetical protein
VNKLAKMDARERADLFAETAERKGLAEAIVEKDFWRNASTIEPNILAYER